MKNYGRWPPTKQMDGIYILKYLNLWGGSPGLVVMGGDSRSSILKTYFVEFWWRELRWCLSLPGRPCLLRRGTCNGCRRLWRRSEQACPCHRTWRSRSSALPVWPKPLETNVTVNLKWDLTNGLPTSQLWYHDSTLVSYHILPWSCLGSQEWHLIILINVVASTIKVL